MKNVIHLDYNDAVYIVDASLKCASELGVTVSVAVLDAAGHLITLSRMDGASFQTPDVARGKALTSVMMKAASGLVEKAALARLTLISFNDGRLPVQGGLPVFSDNQLVGAVGVSGGTQEQDEMIARVGIEAMSSR